MRLEDSGPKLRVLLPVMELIQSGKWTLEDGLIKYVASSEASLGNGWWLSVVPEDRDCLRWLQVFFGYYGIIPEPCFGCYKIVVMPRNFDELMIIKKLQEEMGFPSKCGIEIREYVGRNYGAYWYAPLGKGLGAARRLLNEVKQMLERHFGKEGPKVILKRACTEMERKYGDSNLWRQNEQSAEFYKLLESSYAIVESSQADSEYKRATTLNQWIKWAFERGDETYQKYGIKPLEPTPVDYTDKDHGIEGELIEEVV